MCGCVRFVSCVSSARSECDVVSFWAMVFIDRLERSSQVRSTFNKAKWLLNLLFLFRICDQSMWSSGFYHLRLGASPKHRHDTGEITP